MACVYSLFSSLSLFSVDLVAWKDYEFWLNSKLLRSLRFFHPGSSIYIFSCDSYFFNINVVWALSSSFVIFSSWINVVRMRSFFLKNDNCMLGGLGHLSTSKANSWEVRLSLTLINWSPSPFHNRYGIYIF
jgi:hypothetical protein